MTTGRAARVRAGERPLFTADEEAVQASHVQQHMSGSSDLVDDMVAGVAAAIDADHEAGARGISLRKTLMQVGGGDEQTVRKNEMRVTVMLRDEGYVSRKNRWDESKTMTTRWFFGPVLLGVPWFPIVPMKVRLLLMTLLLELSTTTAVQRVTMENHGTPRSTDHSQKRSLSGLRSRSPVCTARRCVARRVGAPRSGISLPRASIT